VTKGTDERRMAVEELLSAYVDGELSPQERGRIEEILQRDKSASTMLMELKHTKEAVSSLPKMRAPRAFAISEKSEKRGLLGIKAFKLALSLAAVMLVIVVGWGFFTLMSGGMSASPRPQAVQKKLQPAPTALGTPQVKALSAPKATEAKKAKKPLLASKGGTLPTPTATLAPHPSPSRTLSKKPGRGTAPSWWWGAVVALLAAMLVVLFLTKHKK